MSGNPSDDSTSIQGDRMTDNISKHITINLGRFQDHIGNLPDRSVDLVIMDPPYLIDTQGGGAFAGKNRTFDREFKDFSDGITNEDLDLIMSKMKAVNVYVWCNKAQLRQYLDYFDDRGCNIDLLTWHKSNPVPRCNNKYLSDTEYVIFARDPGVPLGGNYSTSASIGSRLSMPRTRSCTIT